MTDRDWITAARVEDLGQKLDKIEDRISAMEMSLSQPLVWESVHVQRASLVNLGQELDKVESRVSAMEREWCPLWGARCLALESEIRREVLEMMGEFDKALADLRGLRGLLGAVEDDVAYLMKKEG